MASLAVLSIVSGRISVGSPPHCRALHVNCNELGASNCSEAESN
jgi:hypothetical protein